MARGTDIIIGRIPPPVLLMQLDDLSSAALSRLTSAAFLILATSPGNHQAWLAAEGRNGADLGRRVKKAAGADPSASGATRVAGSVNCKRKYVLNFPTVDIVDARAGGIVTAAELDAMGLVAAAERSTGGGFAGYLGAWAKVGSPKDVAEL